MRITTGRTREQEEKRMRTATRNRQVPKPTAATTTTTTATTTPTATAARKPSINQSTNQQFNRSTNPPVNQSISQSIYNSSYATKNMLKTVYCKSTAKTPSRAMILTQLKLMSSRIASVVVQIYRTSWQIKCHGPLESKCFQLPAYDDKNDENEDDNRRRTTTGTRMGQYKWGTDADDGPTKYPQFVLKIHLASY